MNDPLPMNPKAISSDLMYNMKASSFPGTSYRASLQPQNASSFQPGSLCVITIPAGRVNTVYDQSQSYLRFTVQQNSATNSFNIDNTAFCFINRVDIFHGSNLLETIQQQNCLVNAIADVQCNTSQKVGLQNTWGFSNDTFGRQGCDMSGNGYRQTFCLPMFSGTVGCLLNKTLPLHELYSDIRVEITFEQANLAVVWNGAVGLPWSIINVELEAQIIQLGDDAMRMYRQVSPKGSPIYIATQSYRHYVASLPANYAGTFSTIIPARFASLKSLLVLPRRSTEIISPTSYSLSSRINFNASNFNWNVGGAIIPQKPIQAINQNTTGSYSEVFCELVKAFHSLNNFEYSTSLPYAYFNVADAADVLGGGVTVGQTGALSYQNGFMMGTELELYAKRNDTILSGLNTLNTQLSFQAEIITPTTETYTLDVYALYDMILIIEDGIMRVQQ